MIYLPQIKKRLCSLSKATNLIAHATSPRQPLIASAFAAIDTFADSSSSLLSTTSMSSNNNSREEFIIAYAKNKIVLWSCERSAIIRRLSCPIVASSSTVTCLVVSPNNEFMATGHSRGEILLWNNLPAVLQGAEPVCTRLHWHAHAVTSLTISSENSRLYSGGHEGVLVVWQINFGKQTFLPRLGQVVTSIVQRYKSE